MIGPFGRGARRAALARLVHAFFARTSTLSHVPVSSFSPCLSPFISDAVWLSAACKALRSAVSSSKWPPWHPSVVVSADGTVSEPLWNHFSAKCSPEGGGAGIQAALDACEEGGAILLEEGVYDVMRTLRIRRNVHLFGRFAVELRMQGGGGQGAPLILCTSLETATLDRLRISGLD